MKITLIEIIISKKLIAMDNARSDGWLGWCEAKCANH